MAEPLSPLVGQAVSPAKPTREGSIELMEQAVRLLRQAPLSTLLCHWLGSAPLALALLLFRNQVARPRVPASTAALYALLLTLLLIWMNCWRAVFAGRLRRQLSGAADAPWRGPWSARRVFRLIAAQAYFGATKLFILPLAALIMFTFADTVAFYRIATVLAAGDDSHDLDAVRLRSRARQLAAFASGQNWTILAILFLLQVVAAINLTLAIAALPQLFRILTGIETAFSRSGWVFVVNPLFPFLVIAVTWLALDPFVQAVYCVRCFRAESIETGEDVRAGLRRIRAARLVVNAAAVLFLLVVAGQRPGHAADAVSPDRLEQAIQQTMQSHEYDWRLPPPADSARGHSWIVDATDRAIAGLRSVFHSIGEAIRAFFKWLLRQFGAMPQPGSGAPPGTALHWSVYVLIGLALAFALWIAWQKRRARRAKAAHVAADSLTAVHLHSEDLTPDSLPEEQWLELALRCLGEQNFRLALRAYYLANLAWLGRTEFITIHYGKTNREYELELRRRARAFPEARGLFAANVAAFERAWYGMHEVTVEDTGEFRNRMEQIKAQMKATPGAPKEAAA